MEKVLFLISAFLLVWGLRLQSDPASASKGNKLASVGMLFAIFSAIIMPLENSNSNLIWVIVPLSLSSVIGYLIAQKIKMTSMPQMVSIFNGLGGLSAVLLSFTEIYKWIALPDSYGITVVTVLISSLFIGSVAFTGSLLAFAKLDGYRWSEKLTLPFQHLVNIIFLSLIVGSSYLFVANPDISYLYLIIILSFIYGIFFVAPIGGADMPVVISLLNSFTGITAALTGIIFGNIVMLLGGILVGAAGTILTILMCNAMNRSLLNVIIKLLELELSLSTLFPRAKFTIRIFINFYFSESVI